jgi:tripartite-type tricarboxylate transporter receptor subunit TctC
MKPVRRKFLHLAAGALALPVVSRIATAQTYPARPISLVVPFAAGGAADTLARIMVERMREPLGQPVVIENVTGADGTIGTARAARARPDGYTLCLGTNGTHVLNGAFYSLPYDVLNDFVPVSPLVTYPDVLYARRTITAGDLNELVGWLKANKASAGIIAGDFRLITMFFQRQIGATLTLVPYRGGAPAVQDLAAGQIDILIATPLYLPLVRAGSIKAFAVTSEARFAEAPELSTFTEIGLPALSYYQWTALFAPRGTPEDIISKLNRAAIEALANPAVRSRLAELGFEALSKEKQTPQVLATMQKAVAEKWLPLVKEFGIQAE